MTTCSTRLRQLLLVLTFNHDYVNYGNYVIYYDYYVIHDDDPLRIPLKPNHDYVNYDNYVNYGNYVNYYGDG